MLFKKAHRMKRAHVHPSARYVCLLTSLSCFEEANKARLWLGELERKFFTVSRKVRFSHKLPLLLVLLTSVEHSPACFAGSSQVMVWLWK